MLICPCKECPNQGCGAYHSQCEDYIKWKTEFDAIKQKERQSREFDRAYTKPFYKKKGWM